jgi:hypothetical protein
MGNRIAFALVVAVGVVGATAYADYAASDTGTWPKSWPVELEPLRKQSRTLEGPLVLNLHYAIPFATREEFEAAWPHIVKVKRKGAPLYLKRGPNFFLGQNNMAGVVVHCPPRDQTDDPGQEQGPVSGRPDAGARPGNAYSLELVVDGKTVDLNRIALPAVTPIIDDRFK